MKRILQTVLAVAAIAAGIFLWRVLFPSDETRILKLLSGLADTASLPANEGNIGRVRRIERLSSAFTPDIVIRFTPLGDRAFEISGRDEIQQAAMAARGAAQSVKIDFIDIRVTEADGAAGKGTAELTAKIQAGNDRDFGIQPLRITLKKEKDFGWRISRIESFRALN